MLLEKILIFIIFLGPLVFFHELGHFFFARLFGVKVEVFSIGFGPKFLRWKRGATEYALSVIPLGGYVKMFGDDPLAAQDLTEDEKKVAFTHKGKWARFWIVFGGPLANFILAFFIYLGLVSFGENVPQARFGRLETGAPFYEMGFRTGDALKKINDNKIQSFDDLNLVDSEVDTVTVERNGQSKTVDVDMKGIEFVQAFSRAQSQLMAPVVADSSGNRYFISTDSKKPDLEVSYEALLASNPESLYLYKITGGFEDISSLEEAAYEQEPSRQISARGGSLEAKGFFPSDLMVGSIVMGSPADKAGLKQGDIITALDGEKLTGFNELRNTLQEKKAQERVQVSIIREGDPMSVALTPEPRSVNGKEVLTIGVYSGAVFMPLKMVESRAESVSEALVSSWDRTWEGMAKTALGFKKLITAEVPLQSIGGPLAIGQVASESFNISLSMFFRLMALISINLGIINLFPIPVLDGGHIVFIFLELVNRGPLSRKKIQVAQQFGMSLLFILIFVALFNDITRIF